MTKSQRKQVSELRRRLENPYAYIEQIEGSELSPGEATAAAVAASRKLLENPFAHLGADGELEGLAAVARDVTSAARAAPSSGGKVELDYQQNRARRTSHAAWTAAEIEAKASELQRQIWFKREALWSNEVPADPVDLLAPSIALREIGFDFGYEEDLGQMHGASGIVDVAGQIDPANRTVRIARKHSLAVRNFTAAHELGHAVLHPHLGVRHQDKLLDGSSAQSDRVETEANKFATCFLMPAKLVKARFQAIFGMSPFEPTEDSAFAIGRSLGDLRKLKRKELSKLLAGLTRCNGMNHVPLHDQFRVSQVAMAIRLEELGLVIF